MSYDVVAVGDCIIPIISAFRYNSHKAFSRLTSHQFSYHEATVFELVLVGEVEGIEDGSGKDEQAHQVRFRPPGEVRKEDER